MKNNYLIAILLFFNFCFSQDGTLDLTFLADHRESKDGEGVTKEFGPFKPGTIYSKLVQPDGKILIGGDFTSYNGHPKISIARLNADGTVDNAFIAKLGHSDILRSMDLQSDGKIIIVGKIVMPITFISNNRVNIEKLTTGLYIIKAFTSEGEFQSKFIKN